MVAIFTAPPAVHIAPVYDVQKWDGKYQIMQLFQDGKWWPIGVSYTAPTGAWAKIGRMVTLKQRGLRERSS